MKYLSVCSGIEAATVAWHPLGWEPVGFSEIEPFPCAVLRHHYPDVPNLGDMTRCDEWEIENGVDVLVGGTPCQSFSLAGNRAGMDDSRGRLAIKFFDIVKRYNPKWIVWENVPGVITSNQGRDFGLFLSEMGKCGYGFAYRVLDAQYFGVAQRRRRVFVIGYLGDWRPSAAVLFERQSLRWNLAKSGKTREDIAKCLTRGASQRFDAETETMIPERVGALDTECGLQKITNQSINSGHVLPIFFESSRRDGVRIYDHKTSNTLQAYCGTGGGNGPMVAQTKKDDAEPCIIAFQSVGDGSDSRGNLSPIIRRHDPMAIAHSKAVDLCNQTIDGQTAATLTGACGGTTSSGPKVMQMMAVRRLTPRECERLQGFSDNYTAIPWRGKSSQNCPDGPRYKALGNSMAVPVMRWIGERIEAVERIINHARR